MFFPDAKTGWAVGHDSVILKSTDEGKILNRSIPLQGTAPLMDILFVDDKTGFAVGAYGLFWKPPTAVRLETAQDH